MIGIAGGNKTTAKAILKTLGLTIHYDILINN